MIPTLEPYDELKQYIEELKAKNHQIEFIKAMAAKYNVPVDDIMIFSSGGNLHVGRYIEGGYPHVIATLEIIQPNKQP